MAVGVNGEIGYIAIQESPVVMGTTVATADMTMQHLHNSTLVSPVHLAMGTTVTVTTNASLDPQTTGNFTFYPGPNPTNIKFQNIFGFWTKIFICFRGNIIGEKTEIWLIFLQISIYS